MSVDARHPEYTAREGQWQRIRDCMEGEDAVKTASTKYLPKLTGQDENEYYGYKSRALFYNATGRTLEGLVGALFRKDPVVDAPDAVKEEIDKDATLTGCPFVTFAKIIAADVTSAGRSGVIVDMAAVGAARPYMRRYSEMQIINWATQVVDGHEKLTMVVLSEVINERAEDGFKIEQKEKIRVLRITGDDEADFKAGTYVQDIWRKRESNETTQETWIKADTLIPQVRGKPLEFIPFQFFGPVKNSPTVERPPLLDLADVNLSHYRSSADLEHGAHFTALPTPWVTGAASDAEMRIGSGVAWMLEDGASAGMLEYTGRGLDALEKRLERKEAHMAVLGARLLEDQKAGVEAADTVRMRHSGQNSVLAAIANGIGEGLSNCLEWYQVFLASTKTDATVAINRDFGAVAMSPQELAELVKAWQSGAIGGEVLFHNLEKGERLPDDMSFESWQEDVQQNGATAAMGGPFDEAADINSEDA